MNREIAEPVLLAVVAIVALSVAAATLPSATESGGSGEGSLFAGSGDGWLLPAPEPAAEPSDEPRTASWIVTLLVILAGISFLLYLLVYRREALAEIAGVVVAIGLVALVFWLASNLDLSTAGLPSWGDAPATEPSFGSADSPRQTPPVALLFVIGAVLVGAVAILLRGGSIASLVSSSDETAASEEAAAVGRAARRAADRIESTADVENGIYRAWREMTELLDVSRPESSTPGEFATAAVDAGMDRTDVDDLTRLFEDVRYGDEAPTEPRERRAVAILRRIEATYAHGEADA